MTKYDALVKLIGGVGGQSALARGLKLSSSEPIEQGHVSYWLRFKRALPEKHAVAAIELYRQHKGDEAADELAPMLCPAVFQPLSDVNRAANA